MYTTSSYAVGNLYGTGAKRACRGASRANQKNRNGTGGCKTAYAKAIWGNQQNEECQKVWGREAWNAATR